MTDKPQMDIGAAHKYFSASCFNKTWEYIDKAGDRTPEDDRAMLHTAIASLWHWSQREDVQPENLSVGYWQVSRVYALLGEAGDSRRYAEFSLNLAEGSEPFYIGFAYEALARAEMVAGNESRMQEHLDKALMMAEKVTDEEDKQILMGDLGSIR